MWKTDAKRNLRLFFRAGLPFTIIGMAIIFTGIYALKKVFAGSDYLTGMLFLWLALFWFIYQPLFRKRIQKVAGRVAPK